MWNPLHLRVAMDDWIILAANICACLSQETTSFQHPAHHETIYESTGIKFPQWLWGHVHWWNSCICRRSWCKAPEDRNTSAIRKMCRQRKGTLEQKLNFLIFLITFLLFCCVFDLILISCRAVRWGSSHSSQPRHCWHCPDFSAWLSFLPAGCEYLNFIDGFYRFFNVFLSGFLSVRNPGAGSFQILHATPFSLQPKKRTC